MKIIKLILFKIKKELNKKEDSIKYVISDLDGDNEKSFSSIEELIDHIDNNYIIDSKVCDIKLSRILYFKYLLKDINNRCLTISHPSSFEDIKERVCKFSNRFYICCFSKTTDSKDEYAWWKIYGQVPNDKFDNIKIRITVKADELIKNILDKGCINFIYYFGDIKYINDKKERNEDDIKDFFQKDDSFFFENEFRVLVDCKCENDNRIKRDENNIPYFLELPINIDLYRKIKLDNDKYSFNPYKSIEERDKNAIKYLLKEAQEKI